MLLAAVQKVGAGLSTSGLIGRGLGIEVVFVSILFSVMIKPIKVGSI